MFLPGSFLYKSPVCIEHIEKICDNWKRSVSTTESESVDDSRPVPIDDIFLGFDEESVEKRWKSWWLNGDYGKETDGRGWMIVMQWDIGLVCFKRMISKCCDLTVAVRRLQVQRLGDSIMLLRHCLLRSTDPLQFSLSIRTFSSQCHPNATCHSVHEKKHQPHSEGHRLLNRTNTNGIWEKQRQLTLICILTSPPLFSQTKRFRLIRRQGKKKKDSKRVSA